MRRRLNLPVPSLPAVLLGVMLSALWVAGGASRPDAAGQAVVRVVAGIVLVVAVLFADRPRFASVRPVALFLLAAALLASAQLVPLPPVVWEALPGRAMLRDAATLGGMPQPWRPWSIVPDATVNALASLIVPAATLCLLAGLQDGERRWLPGLLLCLLSASVLVGLLQFSGGGFVDPFVNASPDEVSGTFANRNHFALFLAMGFALIPVWIFQTRQGRRWRVPVGLALVPLFALTILASGSRAGMALGAVGLMVGIVIGWPGIREELRRYPAWVLPAAVGAVMAVLSIAVLVSIAAGRALSVDRALAIGIGHDMRQRGLPTVWAMIGEYFPFGSGFGGFDPLFRMHEPFTLLKLTYFNHAHNDYLEIALDAGLPGIALVIAALGWWAWKSRQAWRPGRDGQVLERQLGSALLLLTIVASLFDYPARTPLIMAMIVIAGCWLAGRPFSTEGSTLPVRSELL